MSRASSALVDELVGHLSSLERTRTKMENLYTEKKILIRDLEKVYESLFIRTMTYFEGFIEELFFGLLTKRIKPSLPNINLRVEFRSDVVAKDVVLGGKDYLDWFPYNKTETLAYRYFTGGRPFSFLDGNDKEHLSKMLKIRNVIAHQSSISQKKFYDAIVAPTLASSTPLMLVERNPAGYLRGKFRVAPVQVRFEIYQIKLVDIAIKIGGYR